MIINKQKHFFSRVGFFFRICRQRNWHKFLVVIVALFVAQDHLYRDPSRWGMALQTYVQLTMLKIHTKPQVVFLFCFLFFNFTFIS